jgi:hypothetical protein
MKSNKSKCGVYPDQAVPNIPQFGIRRYNLWYTVIQRSNPTSPELTHYTTGS